MEGFAVGTAAGRRGGLCVGLSADSEYSIKPREDELIFILPWGIRQETGSH